MESELEQWLEQYEQELAILKTTIKDHLRDNKHMSLPLEEHEIQALVSGLERLKDHHLERSRFGKSIPSEEDN